MYLPNIIKLNLADEMRYRNGERDEANNFNFTKAIPLGLKSERIGILINNILEKTKYVENKKVYKSFTGEFGILFKDFDTVLTMAMMAYKFNKEYIDIYGTNHEHRALNFIKKKLAENLTLFWTNNSQDKSLNILDETNKPIKIDEHTYRVLHYYLLHSNESVDSIRIKFKKFNDIDNIINEIIYKNDNIFISSAIDVIQNEIKKCIADYNKDKECIKEKYIKMKKELFKLELSEQDKIAEEHAKKIQELNEKAKNLYASND